MTTLPEELIIEILLWLPVMSLKRFRCLSKSLCAAIDSPDFISSHLIRSSLNFNLRKLIFPDLLNNKFIVCDVNLDDLDLGSEILCESNLSEKSSANDLLRNSWYEREFGLVHSDVSDLEEEIINEGKVFHLEEQIFGYCNGLVLLHVGKFRFALWNPSTDESNDLPECPIEVPDDIELYRFFWFGLGYDNSTNDYKVLLVIRLKREFSENELQVWIYGLKSNIWRRAQNFPYHVGMIGKLYEFGYFADGSLHWLCNKWNSDIMAFDMIKETFSLMPQPVCSIKLKSVFSLKLHVLEGSLCISYYSSALPSQADLYIRKKDKNDRFSWTQLYSVKEPLSFDIAWFKHLNVLGYSKRRDKILLDFGSRMPCMVLYDLKKKNFGKVDVDKDRSWDIPIFCIESLVSVDADALF